MALDYSKAQEKYLREKLDKEMLKAAYPWVRIGYKFKDGKFKPFKEYVMPSEDKQSLLHRIAKMIIRLTHKYHKKDRDIVGELYDNSLAIDQLIGQEMERILLKREEKIQ